MQMEFSVLRYRIHQWICRLPAFNARPTDGDRDVNRLAQRRKVGFCFKGFVSLKRRICSFVSIRQKCEKLF